MNQKQYKDNDIFNLQALPERLIKKGKWEEYEPNSILVLKGDSPDYIYFIKKGTVVGSKDSSNGNDYQYFKLNHTNGSIGLLEILAGQQEYIATISTITKVSALIINSKIVYEEIMNNPNLMRKCIRLLADDLYKRSDHDGIMYYMTGLNRLRYYLVSYCEIHKSAFEKKEYLQVRAEYQDIANEIGMSIRTVGRNLQKLKQNKEIEDTSKKIIISHNQYLEMIKRIETAED